MTEQEIKKALDATGYPVAYHHFTEAKKPPFLVYLVGRKRAERADDELYQKIKKIRIELYTDKKDQKAESTVEKALEPLEMIWESDEEWIESEELYQISYEGEVLG